MDIWKGVGVGGGGWGLKIMTITKGVEEAWRGMGLITMNIIIMGREGCNEGWEGGLRNNHDRH